MNHVGVSLQYLHVVTTDVSGQLFASVYVGDTKNAAV